MSHPETSFEATALPLLPDLYRVAFCMVHDRHTAERLVEQAFAEGHHATEVSAIRMHLFAALFRLIRQRRKAWLHIKGWLTKSHEGEYGSAELPAHCHQNDMLRALDGIPEILREVLILSDVEEFTKREISEMLGLSEPVVEARRGEARARLMAGLMPPGSGGAARVENPVVA